MTDFSRIEKQLEQVALMLDSLETTTGNGHTVELLRFPRADCF